MLLDPKAEFAQIKAAVEQEERLALSYTATLLGQEVKEWLIPPDDKWQVFLNPQTEFGKLHRPQSRFLSFTIDSPSRTLDVSLAPTLWEGKLFEFSVCNLPSNPEERPYAIWWLLPADGSPAFTVNLGICPLEGECAWDTNGHYYTCHGRFIGPPSLSTKPVKAAEKDGRLHHRFWTEMMIQFGNKIGDKEQTVKIGPQIINREISEVQMAYHNGIWVETENGVVTLKCGNPFFFHPLGPITFPQEIRLGKLV